jgi:hypothetical protein
LAGSAQQAQGSDGFIEMLPPTILQVLQMPAVLHLAFVLNDQLRGTLLRREILVALLPQKIHK